MSMLYSVPYIDGAGPGFKLPMRFPFPERDLRGASVVMQMLSDWDCLIQ